MQKTLSTISKVMSGLASLHLRAGRRGGAKKAFTLLETLVAISILLVSITGPMVIVSQSLKQSYYARDQVTAFYLAQEAVEYIRNQRDNNGLQGTGYSSTQWLNKVGCDPDNPADCYINEPGSTNVKAELVLDNGVYKLKRCTSDPCPAMRYDAANNIMPYGSVGGDISQFTREIVLTVPQDEINPPTRALDMIVTVYWHTGTVSNKVAIREEITNWQLEK